MNKDASRGAKAVIITVLVVKPRRRSSSNINCRHQHHHQVQCRPKHNATSGYNRRAELLLYSRNLRALALREKAPTTIPTDNPQVPNKIIPVRRKPKIKRSPACLGNWEMLLLPGFVLRSLAGYRAKREKKREKKKPSQYIGNKMNAIAKSFRAQKQPEFLKKLLSRFQGHH